MAQTRRGDRTASWLCKADDIATHLWRSETDRQLCAQSRLGRNSQWTDSEILCVLLVSVGHQNQHANPTAVGVGCAVDLAVEIVEPALVEASESRHGMLLLPFSFLLSGSGAMV